MLLYGYLIMTSYISMLLSVAATLRESMVVGLYICHLCLRVCQHEYTRWYIEYLSQVVAMLRFYDIQALSTALTLLMHYSFRPLILQTPGYIYIYILHHIMYILHHILCTYWLTIQETMSHSSLAKSHHTITSSHFTLS